MASLISKLIRSFKHNENIVMKTTNVIGYFNPNDYSLSLAITEFNMNIQLAPKQYIVDRGGRLVNDPFLDNYVGKGKLSRASDKKKSVEIVSLVPYSAITQAAAVTQAAPHPVTQAVGFHKNSQGVTVPIGTSPTVPVVANPPPQSYNPVRGYSVEEARKLRLIKPVRSVPDDYGADESTGAPPQGSKIPPIRYATDAVRTPVKALPEGLAAPATPQQQALIAQMEQAANQNPDDPNLLGRVSTAVAARTIASNAPPAASSVPPPIPTNPQPTAISVLNPPAALPEPDLGQGQEATFVAEDELPENMAAAVVSPSRAAVPPPPIDEDEAAPPLPVLTCPQCAGKTFKNQGVLNRHNKKFHSPSPVAAAVAQ
jgi:hypothetical protein